MLKKQDLHFIGPIFFNPPGKLLVRNMKYYSAAIVVMEAVRNIFYDALKYGKGVFLRIGNTNVPQRETKFVPVQIIKGKHFQILNRIRG